MKPLIHAKISCKKFGGKPEDYIDIHDWFDSTKAHLPDARHRLVLHNAFGIFLCEQIFGQIIQTQQGFKRMPYITNSDGRQVSVRDIAEQHVIDDMGHIPTLGDCMKDLPAPAMAVGGLFTKPTIVMGKPSDFQIVD